MGPRVRVLRTSMSRVPWTRSPRRPYLSPINLLGEVWRIRGRKRKREREEGRMYNLRAYGFLRAPLRPESRRRFRDVGSADLLRGSCDFGPGALEGARVARSSPV